MPVTLIPRRAPTPGEGVLITIALGAWGALISFLSMTSNALHLGKDFSYPWRAARALLDGQNPYEVIQAVGAYPFNAPLLYPLPAALLAIPVAPLAPALAGSIFMGVSSALLAHVLLRKAPHQLWVFASAPFLHAATLGQWSPLLTAAALIPTLQFAAAAKPTVGLVAWVYQPSWRGAIGVLALFALSLFILPTWPMDWLAAIRSTSSYRGPATTWMGAFLLLGLLRGRRKEGRLFVTLALVPQLPVFYDTVPLWLVPDTGRRALALTLSSWIGYALWHPYSASPDQNAVAMPLSLATIWAPALILVLLLPRGVRETKAAERASAASA